MGISLDEVRRIASLARLELTAAELEGFAEKLGAILDHFERLQQVDTDGVEPFFGAAAGEPSLRPDDPKPGLDPEEALAAAPDSQAGHFRVPRVIG